MVSELEIIYPLFDMGLGMEQFKEKSPLKTRILLWLLS